MWLGKSAIKKSVNTDLDFIRPNPLIVRDIYNKILAQLSTFPVSILGLP